MLKAVLIGLLSFGAFHASACAETLSSVSITMDGSGQLGQVSCRTVRYVEDARPPIVRINSNGKSFSVQSKYLLDPLDSEHPTIAKAMKGFTRDPSGCLLIGHYGDSRERTLIVLRGEGFASDPGALLVIGFRSDGEPYKMLELEEFELYALETAPIVSIVGSETLSQMMTNLDRPTKTYATTYDPRSVFLIADEKAKYSLEASHAYNIAHYVWAGPKSREDYAVIYNFKGRRPFGAPASEVSRYVK